MRIETIIISNIAEAFEDIINTIEPSNEKRSRISTEHNLCDRSLLWGGDNKIVITPFKISEDIFDLNKSILQFENVENLFPREIDISLSDAIFDDKELLEYICEIINNNPGIKISPYCITEKFIKLVEFLHSKQLKFGVIEQLEHKSEWLVSYLDSKIGSRVEIGKIDQIKNNTPESIICQTENDVIRVVGWFIKNNRSCVLKSNYGESGWGTLFIKIDDFKNEKEIIDYIRKSFKNDSIWNSNLILVEEYIESNKNNSSGSPSSELFLSPKGVEVAYICDQIVGHEGDFLGIAMGKNILNKKIIDEIKTISLAVGERFWNLGYRGFFDIDFILSNDEILYIIETNMRRTGGTHVYDVANHILGQSLEKKYFVMSQDQFHYGSSKKEKVDIVEKIREVMYPIKGRKEGIIISIINKTESVFGFIIIGDSKETCVNIYNKMLKIINN